MFTVDYDKLNKAEKEKFNITRFADQLFTSIYYNIEKNFINICTDSGRILVPSFSEQNEDGLIKNLQAGKCQFICPNMV